MGTAVPISQFFFKKRACKRSLHAKTLEDIMLARRFELLASRFGGEYSIH